MFSYGAPNVPESGACGDKVKDPRVRGEVCALSPTGLALADYVTLSHNAGSSRSQLRHHPLPKQNGTAHA